MTYKRLDFIAKYLAIDYAVSLTICPETEMHVGEALIERFLRALFFKNGKTPIIHAYSVSPYIMM